MSQRGLRILRACPNATPGPSRLPATTLLRSSRPVALGPHPPSSRRLRPYSTAEAVALASEPEPAASVTTTTVSPPSAAPVAFPGPPNPGNPHPHPAFQTLLDTLSATQPCFGAKGDEITLLGTPQEFKATLLAMIKRAKRRIIISTLYIGTEQEDIVEALREALAKHRYLKVSIVMDFNRGTRLDSTIAGFYIPSTAHMFVPLLEQYRDRCDVWFWRSPKLKGFMERIVPERFDEGWGTWHGKWYVSDEEVMFSGANLAESYFTNRQDRYMHFRSNAPLASYLYALTRVISRTSYRLTPYSELSIEPHRVVPLQTPEHLLHEFRAPALFWPAWSWVSPRGFEGYLTATLEQFQRSWRRDNAARQSKVDMDTWVWPILQSGVLNVKEEEDTIKLMWKAINDSHTGERPVGTEVDLTSGYFGLYAAYKGSIATSPANARIIAAAPKANGFYGSKGLSRLIPEGYTLLERRFHSMLSDRNRLWDDTEKKGVRLKEWEREGWTYHAKGIWLSPGIDPPRPGAPANPNASNPFFTFIGSSNLSSRSVKLDTELDFMISTSSPSLRRQLANELKNLNRYTQDVGAETWQRPERRVSWLAKVLVELGVEGML